MQISMRYYETIEWEKVCIKEKYNRHMGHIIVKTIKITNIQ